MEHQQEAIEKAWKYYQHADNLFMGRVNFFLVAESMVLVAYVTLLQGNEEAYVTLLQGNEDEYKLLRLAIAFLGIVYTFIWFYTNHRLAKRMDCLTSACLKQDTIYRKYLHSTPKKIPSRSLMTYWLPIPTGILWIILLLYDQLWLGIVVAVFWVLVPCYLYYEYNKKPRENNKVESDKPCPFCERDEQLDRRVFYDKGKWFAFLAAPYHTKGHAILAAKPQNEMGCPEGLKEEVLEGFDQAFADVAPVLQEYYQPEDILFASLRGDITHFHCHLIPRWEAEETKWRQEQCYSAKGHLLEFLGHLEKMGDLRAETERKKQNLSDDAYRSKITETLKEEVAALRELTGYGKAR